MIQNRGCSWDELFVNSRNDFTSTNKHHKTKMVIQGHRGGFRPGNSPDSFKMALEKGVKIIELDVSNYSLSFIESLTHNIS